MSKSDEMPGTFTFGTHMDGKMIVATLREYRTDRDCGELGRLHVAVASSDAERTLFNLWVEFLKACVEKLDANYRRDRGLPAVETARWSEVDPPDPQRN